MNNFGVAPKAVNTDRPKPVDVDDVIDLWVVWYPSRHNQSVKRY